MSSSKSISFEDDSEDENIYKEHLLKDLPSKSEMSLPRVCLTLVAPP